MPTRFETVDEYVASLPESARAVVEDVRRTIREAAPGTEETISYGMPAVTLNGKYIVYFGAWRKHIGLYPVPDGDPQLEADLAPYRAGKGTLRFPLKQPMPHDLIERVIAVLLRKRTAFAYLLTGADH